MRATTFSTLVLTLVTFTSFTSAASVAEAITARVSQLRNAPTAADRIRLLSDEDVSLTYF